MVFAWEKQALRKKMRASKIDDIECESSRTQGIAVQVHSQFTRFTQPRLSVHDAGNPFGSEWPRLNFRYAFLAYARSSSSPSFEDTTAATHVEFASKSRCRVGRDAKAKIIGRGSVESARSSHVSRERDRRSLFALAPAPTIDRCRTGL